MNEIPGKKKPESTKGKTPGEREEPASAERTDNISPEPEEERRNPSPDQEPITNQDEQDRITNVDDSDDVVKE
jgi:hypothetical protein